MQTSLFNYDLPEALIAQTPLTERDASRLLVANPTHQTIADTLFADLPNILNSTYCAKGRPPLIIVNRSRVFPARIRITRSSGGRGEVFLLEKKSSQEPVSCLIRPQKKLRVGEILYADKNETSPTPLFKVECLNPPRVVPITHNTNTLIENFGEMPLPPYIQRDPQKTGQKFSSLDKLRYQTLYANEEGSVAAATAGLHFTDKIMNECRALGCEFAHVVLHVGLGTFQPVQATTISDHVMHHEMCLVPAETAQKISLWTAKGWPIIFVGTTSLRTVESFVRHALASHKVPVSELRAFTLKLAQENALANILNAEANQWFSTSLFLHPDDLEHSKTPTLGDAILTNFHQPQSTLTMLVASILSYPFWKKVYAHAVSQQYRFLSYGDSSLLFFKK
jgi:S-adenosylmethionine:tRNA ribosyltransferase-isomerase